MLPRLVLRMRKAVRRLKVAGSMDTSLSGPEIEARWGSMIETLDQRDREAERRLDRAADALNRIARN